VNPFQLILVVYRAHSCVIIIPEYITLLKIKYSHLLVVISSLLAPPHDGRQTCGVHSRPCPDSHPGCAKYHRRSSNESRTGATTSHERIVAESCQRRGHRGSSIVIWVSGEVAEVLEVPLLLSTESRNSNVC